MASSSSRRLPQGFVLSLIFGLNVIESKPNVALPSLAPALVAPSTAVTQRPASHSDLRMENVVWEEQTGSRSYMVGDLIDITMLQRLGTMYVLVLV